MCAGSIYSTNPPVCQHIEVLTDVCMRCDVTHVQTGGSAVKKTSMDHCKEGGMSHVRVEQNGCEVRDLKRLAGQGLQ